MTKKEMHDEPAEESRSVWERVFGVVQIAVAVGIVSFGTWQLFRGNLEAAFSTVPFLVVWYLFLSVPRRR